VDFNPISTVIFWRCICSMVGRYSLPSFFLYFWLEKTL